MDDNSVITLIDRGKRDYVDDISTNVYNLTAEEIKKMKTSNVNTVRFSIQCPRQVRSFKTKDACIKEAKRYFANAQTMLKKGKPKNERYQDIKYVRSASGIAYLAANAAIDGLLISKGASPDKLPKNKSGYLDAISKISRNGKIESWYKNIHDNIHVMAYYRAMYNQKVIETSFDQIKRLIEYVGE